MTAPEEPTATAEAPVFVRPGTLKYPTEPRVETDADGTTPLRSQFVRFAFYKARPSWWDLPHGARAGAAAAFTRLVETWAEKGMLKTFSLVGMRGSVDFMIWQASEELDDLHRFATEFAQTELGRHVDQPQSFLSVTKHSMYVKNNREARTTGHRLHLAPGDRRYLFVYPFVKTRAWYALPKAERQEMMNEHIRVGNKFPSVRLNTTYSFGMDDQEFVVAFETDEARDFVDLVMELRETRASAYTLRDTPMYTCVSATPGEILETLGA